MKKKFSIGKLAAILIIIALISVGSAYLFTNKFYQESNNRENLYSRFIYNTINSSMRDEEYYSDSIFNYAVKSYKKKYYDQDGNVITDPDRISQQRKIDELKSKGLNPDNYLDDYVKDEYLHGEYRTFYLSNDNELADEFDPIEVNLRNKDLIIRGNVKDNKVNITKIGESDRLKKSEFNDISSIFIQNIKDEMRHINSVYDIKNLKFAYYANLNDQVFKDIKNENSLRQFEKLVMCSLVISACLSALVFLIVKLKAIDEEKKVKSIFTLPIEVVAILLGIFLFFSAGILGTNTYNIFPELFIFGLLIGNIIIALTVSYFMINFKSIFSSDVENYLTTNSLIVRGFRKTFHSYNDTFNGKFGEDDIIKVKKDFTIKYLLVVLILLFVFAVLLNARSLTLLIIILGIIFYLGSIKLLNEVTRINYESSKIVMGDYKNKISKGGYIFDRIIDNFNNISKNLDDAVDDALKSERLKTELITNVSHDLKTPLTSIINYSDLINKENATEGEKREYANIIHDKSIKLQTLIDDLFEVSKATSNNIDLNKENLDFKALVEQSIGEWEDKINEKNIEIVTNLPEDRVMLDIDGQKFSRVLDNLFSNIYKYALENSRVYIDLENQGNVKLTMKNISKYQLDVSEDELLERFKRGEKSRTTAGSGLGLSISSSFVEAHGAKFKIEIDGDLFKTIITF